MNKSTFDKIMISFVLFTYLFAGCVIGFETNKSEKKETYEYQYQLSQANIDEIIKLLKPKDYKTEFENTKESSINIYKCSSVVDTELDVEELEKKDSTQETSEKPQKQETTQSSKTASHPIYISSTVVSNATNGDAAQQTYEVDSIIYKVVEAETHGAGKEAKKRIAHVILNRVSDRRFPNSIRGVCTQKNQFAKRSDVAQSTIDAVNEALSGYDTTGGALWFCTCNGCWASRNATYMYTDEVGHKFYK